MAFPREHWSRISSTNPIERINREILAPHTCNRHLSQRGVGSTAYRDAPTRTNRGLACGQALHEHRINGATLRERLNGIAARAARTKRPRPLLTIACCVRFVATELCPKGTLYETCCTRARQSRLNGSVPAEPSARDGVRTRPHSFNAAAAGNFLGRFVEFRAGRSSSI
jgi:hypothetical protein